MDELSVLTWRIPRHAAQVVEAATVPERERDALLPALRDAAGAAEMVYVPTCQRVALVLLRAPPDAAARIVQAYRGLLGRELPAPESLAGRAAFEHLAHAASSLDSLVIGEPQVLGQVKAAAQRCDESGLSGPGLRHVMGLVLRAAKAVRAETGLFRGKVSLVPLTEQIIADHLAGNPAPRAAVLGTGQIGERMMDLLQGHPGLALHVVSRDGGRADEVAKARGAQGHDLASFLAQPPEGLHVVALAMGTDEPILRAKDLERLAASRPVLVLDLAIPRNAEETRAPGLRLVQMDDLSRMSEEAKRARSDEVAHAQGVLAREMDRIEAGYAERRLAHDLADLAARFDEVGEARWGLAQAEGVDLSNPRARKWYEQTLRALLHEATTAVKKAGCDPKSK